MGRRDGNAWRGPLRKLPCLPRQRLSHMEGHGLTHRAVVRGRCGFGCVLHVARGLRLVPPLTTAAGGWRWSHSFTLSLGQECGHGLATGARLAGVLLVQQ